MMPTGDMVQVHLLTAYPAALLNRDDAGLAKRIPFGGAVRTRVSSQCLKKHWRETPEVMIEEQRAVRSRQTFERLVAEPLRAKGADERVASEIAGFLLDLTISSKESGDTGEEEESKKTKGKKAEQTARKLRSEQVTVLTRAEVHFLSDIAEDIIGRLDTAGLDVDDASIVKAFWAALSERGLISAAGLDKTDPVILLDKKKRKAPLSKLSKAYFQHLPASLDTALFGRMVTSDLFSRVDAAVSVAHAFTTHAEAAETDYFTAVDTLKTAEDDAGAGLINDTELTTGVFYTYAVLDMEQLRGNLGAEADRAEALASRLVRAMATVSPGAKRGSTAPYAYAEFVLLERGPQQPRTLANSFLRPVSTNGAGLMPASVQALVGYRARMEAMYEPFEGEQAVATIHHPALGDLGMEPLSLGRALAKIFRTEN
jgi:CRISPR system Cascade subunit CasC